MKAVISADVVGSMELPLELRKMIPSAVDQLMQGSLQEKGRYTYERGDFIQAEMEPELGLKMLLLLKTMLNGLGSTEKTVRQENIEVDIRISLAIGPVEISGPTVGSSDGPAYQLSGRGLDTIKKSRQKLILQSHEADFNEELKVMAASLEFISGRWTKGSAEIISLLLNDLKEMEIAETLGISQSAVNQRKRTAGWEVISLMLERYRSKTIKQP